MTAIKKVLLSSFLFLAAVCAAAHEAHIMVVPSNPKNGIAEADSVAMAACPYFKKGKVSYKDEQDLEARLASIEDYFSQNPLEKRYSLKLMDSKTLKVVGEVTVGGTKNVSLSGDKDKDQMVMSIGAAVLAVLLLALSSLLRKARKAQTLARAVSVILLLLGLLCGILSIIWAVSLGLKMLMKICGPAVIIGAVLLLLLGGAKKSDGNDRLDAAPQKTSQTRHGYSVNGKHFDSLGEAQLYVKQFPYMDNSWITPE